MGAGTGSGSKTPRIGKCIQFCQKMNAWSRLLFSADEIFFVEIQMSQLKFREDFSDHLISVIGRWKGIKIWLPKEYFQFKAKQLKHIHGEIGASSASSNLESGEYMIHGNDHLASILRDFGAKSSKPSANTTVVLATKLTTISSHVSKMQLSISHSVKVTDVYLF